MENREFKTKSVVEAGLICALIVVIMLFNAYVPVFSTVGSFLLPIPVTVLYIRYNYKVTLTAVIVSAILIAILVNPFAAMMSSFLYGITGITLGYCIKKDKKVSITLFYLTLASILGVIFNYVILLSFIEKTTITGFINQIVTMTRESMNMITDLYVKMGMSQEQLKPMLEIWDKLTPELILTLIPALLLISGFASAFINYTITKSILKKLKYTIKDLSTFDLFYLDNRLGALIIIFVCIGIILVAKDYKIGQFVSNSSTVILQFAFLLDGAAVVTYYMKNKLNIGKGFRIAIIVFVLFSQLSMFFIYIGIGDMIFDIRKVDPNRLFKKKEKKG